MRLHRLEICLNHCLISPTGSILTDEPGNRKKLTIVFLNDISYETPRRLGVKSMHPPRPEGLLQIFKRCSRRVVRYLGILHDSNHVLEAIVSRSIDLSIDGCLGCERPGNGEPHASSLNTLFSLSSQHSVQGRH